MPINLPIVLTPPVFPPGFCPASWQAFANTLASGITGYLQGTYNTFNYGSSTPSVDDRVKPWLRLNSDGSPDSWYVWATVGASSGWFWPHPVAAGSAFRQLWVGDPADIPTLDGGDTNTPTNASGPIWEIDTDFSGRSPMGVTAAIDGTPFPVGTNYGESQHTLILAELPAHTHTVSAGPNLDVNGASTRTLFGTDDAIFSETRPSGSVGEDAAHNIVHPVRSTYILKRTSRIFKKAP